MFLHNLSEKGSVMTFAIAIVAIMVVGAVLIMVVQKPVQDEAMEKSESAMMEKEEGAMMEKSEGAMMEKSEGAMMEKEEGAMMEKEEGAMMEKSATGTGDVMMKDDSAMMMKYTGTTLAGKSAPLLNFSKADYDAALKTNKLIVLYFYANWCPVCKAEFPVMQGAFNELTTDNVIGFRVNYNDSDTDANEKELAREFGVAYQHTKVFVKNGQRILKSPEGWDDKRYDIEIGKASTQ